MENFDFNQVHAFMTLLKRSYWYTNGKPPTIAELKSTAETVICQAIESYCKKDGKESTEAGTGGFVCCIFNWSGKPYVRLSYEAFSAKSY